MAVTIGTVGVRRPPASVTLVTADLCVVGSGAAGFSAALEAAALGKRVVVVDGAPSLGGQAVGSVIGTFCGLYSNGPDPYRVTYGVADDLLAHLGAAGAAWHRRARNTWIVAYDVTALSRWVEERFRAAGIVALTGAVVREAERDGRRVARLHAATRWGDVSIEAAGFVDASGDAVLCWLAGCELQVPETPIWGTLMFVLEGVDAAEADALPRASLHRRLAERGDAYGLVRRDGFVFTTDPAGHALVNLTHVETPTDPVGAGRAGLEGRAQADRVVSFLRGEFPRAFGQARVRLYGQPGIRQTRWIRGRHRLTADEVRAGAAFSDSVLRCAWPIELHHRADGVHWEELGDAHLHHVPFASLTPRDLDNVIAAGRCIDADPVALSSVRVMGPCIAMGAAAAHGLDLAGAGSVHQIDADALRGRIRDNLERSDDRRR